MGPLADKNKPRIMRSRVSKPQVSHFIDWLFSSGALQNSSYGLSKLKFDSGEKIAFPRPVLVVCREQTVYSYHQFCDITQFSDCLSRTLLLSILENLYTSQRKAISGLDNYIADGISAIDKLLYVIKYLNLLEEEKKQLSALILKIQVFLKIQYKAHCMNDLDCATHCQIFALSDTSTKDNIFSSLPCAHISHSINCESCGEVFTTLQNIHKSVASEKKFSREKRITI